MSIDDPSLEGYGSSVVTFRSGVWSGLSKVHSRQAKPPELLVIQIIDDLSRQGVDLFLV